MQQEQEENADDLASEILHAASAPPPSTQAREEEEQSGTEATDDDLEYEEELAQLYESRTALYCAQAENHALHEQYEKLRAVKNKLAVIEEKKQAQKQAARMQAENARLQREIVAMEEDVFRGNAVAFIDLLANPSFVRVIDDSDSNTITYVISNKSTQERDEMSTFWESDRLYVRPWNHNEINLSVPVTYLCRPWLKNSVPYQLQHKCSFNTLEDNKKDFGLMASKRVRGRIQRTPVTPADRIRFKDAKYKLRGLS